MEKQRDNHIEQNVMEQNTTEQGGIYRKIRDFALDETGVGVIELVLILVVLVSLVIAAQAVTERVIMLCKPE